MRIVVKKQNTDTYIAHINDYIPKICLELQCLPFGNDLRCDLYEI